MLRNNFEIYASILSRAKKGALKWHLQTDCKVSTAGLKNTLLVLLNTGLLTIDESKFKICKNGQCRNVVYKTSEKGKKFLETFYNLQNLIRTKLDGKPKHYT